MRINSLTTRFLLAIVLSTTVPFLAFGWYVRDAMREREQREANLSLREEAKNAASRIAARLDKAQRLAAKELMSRRAAILEGRYARRQRVKAPTFAEYVSQTYTPLLRRSSMKEGPREREIHRVTEGALGRFFGSYRLPKITRSEVERFIDQKVAGAAGPAGVNRDLARLRHLLNDAADRPELGIDLHRIPWRRLTMREEPESYRPMRDDEEPRLLGNLSDRIVRDLVEFLIHTGVRPDAAFGLQWQHVSLEQMVIEINRDLDKVGRGYRVYANSRVQEILRGLYAWRPVALRQPESFVFGHRNGGRRRSIRTAWKRVCRAASIEGLHVRGLRATASTRLQERGANEFDVKLHLAHAVSSMGVTGRYIDPHEDHRRRVAELTIRHSPSNVVELHPRRHPRPSTPDRAAGTLPG